jgi:hypothetical protein
MGAKADVQHAVSAEVATSPERAYEACQRAVAPLGKKAEIERASGGAVVSFYPGFPRSLSSRSPVVAVSIGEVGDGRVAVRTEVGGYRTLQTKVLGFIPAGVKRLVGRSQFFTFLTNLEHELGALDPAGAAVVRHRPS